MSLIDTLAVLQQQLTLYVYPFWLVFGISGCLLNLVVFSRPNLRKTSCSIYFFAASVDHLMTLTVGISPALHSLWQPSPQIQSLLFCKIWGYLFQISLMLSRWFVACASIDRYALTSDKARLRNFAERKTAYCMIFGIIIIWSIICSHRLIFYEVQNNICGILNNVGAALYHSIYVIIGGGVLPTIIMVTCSLFIRRNLTERHQRRLRLSRRSRHENTTNQQLLKLLYIQIIFYIIIIIPQLGNLVFGTISITIPNRSIEHTAIQQFVAFIAELILYLFPVTSFYLYTLTSRTFRKELVKFFYSIAHIWCKNQVIPALGTVLVDYRLANPQAIIIVSADRTVH